MTVDVGSLVRFCLPGGHMPANESSSEFLLWHENGRLEDFMRHHFGLDDSQLASIEGGWNRSFHHKGGLPKFRDVDGLTWGPGHPPLTCESVHSLYDANYTLNPQGVTVDGLCGLVVGVNWDMDDEGEDYVHSYRIRPVADAEILGVCWRWIQVRRMQDETTTAYVRESVPFTEVTLRREHFEVVSSGKSQGAGGAYV